MKPQPLTPAALSQAIKKDANQCVKCGLCLPHCPTYQLHSVEGESPRGRIALAEALVSHQLPPTPTGVKHLDHCLLCLRCESVCPAGVKMGTLMDHTQTWLTTHHGHQPPSRTLRRLRFLLAYTKPWFSQKDLAKSFRNGVTFLMQRLQNSEKQG